MEDAYSQGSPSTPVGPDGRPSKRRRGRPIGSLSRPKEERERERELKEQQRREAIQAAKDAAAQAAQESEDERSFRRDERLSEDDESGWITLPLLAFGNDTNPSSVAMAILNTLKRATDKSGGQVVAPFLTVPERQESTKRLYDNVSEPICINAIEERIVNGIYPTIVEFDKDLFKMIDDMKWWITYGSTYYGNYCAIRFLYQEITKSVATPETVNAALEKVSAPAPEASPIPPNGVDTVPNTPFAAQVPAKATIREKTILESIHLKGETLRVGDFLHVMNIRDPAKPIVAQIFKIFKRNESQQRCMTVCWYYRPEETIHMANRQFYPNEVFKSGNFVDHNVEDFVDRCLVMFYTKYVRGRPKYPIWHKDLTTYLCEHRYKDDSRNFKKIKNWASCIPEDVRRREDDLDEFQRAMVLTRVSSPFVRGIKGPGRVGEPIGKEEEDQAKYYLSNDGSDPKTRKVRPVSIRKSTPGQDDQGSPGPSNMSNRNAPLAAQRYGRPSITSTQMGAFQDTFRPLPAEIENKFKTNENEELAWYPVPPLQPQPATKPAHSIAYLNFVAQNRIRDPATSRLSVSVDAALDMALKRASGQS